MTWIESHSTMRNHKKLTALCNALQINRAEAIGHLHMLWWWAIENRDNGDLTDLFDRDIALACDWSADAKKLIDALHATGWIKDYHISDWDDYSWRLLGMRKSNRERQRKHRDVTRDVTRYVPPATEQNSTEQNKEVRKEHARPSLDSLKTFFKNDTLAASFFDYYEANGWKVGKNHMKNWEAAARNWQRRQGEFGIKKAAEGWVRP